MRHSRRRHKPADGLPTRQQLMQAALHLMAEDRSFTSLSLREVTRRAGVAPNTFYRHFADMDDLALALIDEIGLTLRRLLREARRVDLRHGDILRRSIAIYVAFVREHPLEFLFAVRERAGGSAAIRAALAREIGHFSAELAADLKALGAYPELSAGTLETIAEMVISLMLNAATDLLEIPGHHPALEQALVDRYVRRLALIFLGGTLWKESAPAAAAVAGT